MIYRKLYELLLGQIIFSRIYQILNILNKIHGFIVHISMDEQYTDGHFTYMHIFLSSLKPKQLFFKT